MAYKCIILTDSLTRERLRPPGAFIIGDVLRKAGFETLVIDMFSRLLNKNELMPLLERVVSDETLFVGYSSTFFPTSQSAFAPFNGPEGFIELNRQIKEKYPHVKIVVGGGNSTNYEDALYHREFHVDYIVGGFAESMVVELAQSLHDKTEPKFSRMIGNTRKIEHDITAKNHDFRNYNHMWHESDCLLENEALTIEVARGCVFKCKFCTFPLIGKHKNDMSYIRLEDNILREVQDNYDKHKTTTYLICDDTFNERTDKIEMMLRMRDRSKLDLNFVGYIRLDLLAQLPEQIPLLKELNFNGFFCGIETLNPLSAKCVGKSTNPQAMIDTLHKMNDMWDTLVVHTAYILGLPYETPETADYWINQLMDPNLPIDTISINAYAHMVSDFGKNEFFTNPEKYGYKPSEDPSKPWNWTNDVWSHEECRDLAMNYMKNFYDSGRLRLGPFAIAGLCRLGYNFYDLAGMSMKTFDEVHGPNISLKIEDYENRYFSKLDQYLRNNGY